MHKQKLDPGAAFKALAYSPGLRLYSGPQRTPHPISHPSAIRCLPGQVGDIKMHLHTACTLYQDSGCRAGSPSSTPAIVIMPLLCKSSLKSSKSNLVPKLSRMRELMPELRSGGTLYMSPPKDSFRIFILLGSVAINSPISISSQHSCTPAATPGILAQSWNKSVNRYGDGYRGSRSRVSRYDGGGAR